MTSQFDRLLKEMETEVKRLAVLRKEFNQEKVLLVVDLR